MTPPPEPPPGPPGDRTGADPGPERPLLPEPPEPADLAALLVARGVPPGVVAAAVADGTLPMLALERLATSPGRFTAAEAARRAGVPVEWAHRLWRALGFPDPPPDEPRFTEVDAELLGVMHRLVVAGVTDEAVAMELSRVMGSAAARLAESHAAILEAVTDDRPELAGWLIPRFLQVAPAALELVWRKHLADAARRRRLRAGDAPMGIGFADMVGFVVLSQQLEMAELAAVVDRFGDLTADVVAAHGGRVVKTIGDEIMFAADEPAPVAEIGLTLAERCAEDRFLTDVRVGLGWGPVLEHEGDLYGPTVNLAARAVQIAYPGTVIAAPELREALADDPRYRWVPVRPHRLQGIGRVTLYALRRAGDGPGPHEASGAGAARTGPVRRRAERRRSQLAERARARRELLAGEARPRGGRDRSGGPSGG